MISSDLATFLEQGLAINIGTRNQRLEPNAAYCPAARVDAGGTRLTVFVPEIGAAAVLADLAANGQAAIVFARPEDDRACQVKGTFVSARPAAVDEQALVQAQWHGFMHQLDLIGTPGESTRTWTIWPCVAVQIAVTAVYSQTPGPDAGARVS